MLDGWSGSGWRVGPASLAAVVACVSMLMVGVAVGHPVPASASPAKGRVSMAEFNDQKRLIEAHEAQVEDFADTLGIQQKQCVEYEQDGENVKQAFVRIVSYEEKVLIEDEKKLLAKEKSWAQGLAPRSAAYKTREDKKLVKTAGSDLSLSIAHAEDALHDEMAQAAAFSFFRCSETDPLGAAEANDRLASEKFADGVIGLREAIQSEP